MTEAPLILSQAFSTRTIPGGASGEAIPTLWSQRLGPDTPSRLAVVGGSLEAIQRGLVVAIIGSRSSGPGEEGVTRRVVDELATKTQANGIDLTVVSGLAIGPDGWAHDQLLRQSNGTTHLHAVAVLGNSLDAPVYPPENASLAKRIVEAGGAIVSEHLSPVDPAKYAEALRRRNRITVAQNGLIVIAGDSRGGTRIAVDAALQEGVPVFVVNSSAITRRGILTAALQGDLQGKVYVVSTPAEIFAQYSHLFPAQS